MRKMLFISAICLIIAAANIHGQTATAFKPLSEFRGDTLAYLKYNFVENKDQYVGKSFKNIVADLAIPISGFDIILDPGVGWGYLKDIYINYGDMQDLRDGLMVYGLKIVFEEKTYYIKDNPQYRKSGVRSVTRRKDAYEAFGLMPDCIVKDIQTYDFRHLPNRRR